MNESTMFVATLEGLKSYLPLVPFEMHKYIDRCEALVRKGRDMGIKVPSPMIDIPAGLVGLYWSDDRVYITTEFESDSGTWHVYMSLAGNNPENNKTDLTLENIPFNDQYIKATMFSIKRFIETGITASAITEHWIHNPELTQDHNQYIPNPAIINRNK